MPFPLSAGLLEPRAQFSVHRVWPLLRGIDHEGTSRGALTSRTLVKGTTEAQGDDAALGHMEPRKTATSARFRRIEGPLPGRPHGSGPCRSGGSLDVRTWHSKHCETCLPRGEGGLLAWRPWVHAQDRKAPAEQLDMLVRTCLQEEDTQPREVRQPFLGRYGHRGARGTPTAVGS